MSCATMPISPEDVLSAESEGGSPLPLGGLPASSAGFLRLVQEVVILLFYETSNKSEGAAANTQAKTTTQGGEGRCRSPRIPYRHTVRRGRVISLIFDSATRD